MENLRDYIKLYSNILPDETCDAIVSNVEKYSLEKILSMGFYSYHQLAITNEHRWENLGEGISVDSNVGDMFASLTFDGSIAYFQDLGLPLIPELEGFEGVKIVKYTPNSGDRFDLHNDVSDYKSAKRFLSVNFFLTDSKAEIVFPTLNITFNPKKGDVLIFPPMWMFPYEIKPLKGESSLYFAKTYLHYAT